MNIKKTIEKTLREYDSGINFSESSALTDLMINPLTAILGPYERANNTTLAEQSIQNPEDISETEMDKYASNHYVTRDLGAQATGFVRIYFRSPRTLFIDPSVYFETADGRRFNVNSSYSITSSQMATNVTEFPNVSTGLIPITAETFGTGNEALPSEITKVFGLSVDYAYVKNPVSITGGAVRETNTQLKSRIEGAVINQTIGSDRGIQSLLMNNYTSILDVVVKGANDLEMKRDLVFTTPSGELLSNLPSNFYLSDYFGTISGLTAPPANRSRGYWGVFYVEVPAGSGIQASEVVDPSSFTDEWTNERYTSMYKVNDARYQTITTDAIMQETFAGGTADNETWVKSDGSTRTSQLIHPIELEVESGFIRLGKWIAPSEQPITQGLSGPAEDTLNNLASKVRNRREIE